MDAHYLVCKKMLEDNASIRIQSAWAPDARRRIQPERATRKGKPWLFLRDSEICTNRSIDYSDSHQIEAKSDAA